MTTAAPRLPRILGVSLGGLRGPFLFHGADGRRVARAQPEGAGWWWLDVGDDQAPALVAHPHTRLLSLDLTLVSSIRVRWASAEMTVGDRVMQLEPDVPAPGGRLRWRGVDVVTVRPDRRLGVAAVEHIGVLPPTVTVFAVVALLRWPFDGSGQLTSWLGVLEPVIG